MDWSRLGTAVPDALLLSFLVGAVLSPPDPFTQILYFVPLFAVTLPALYLHGRPSVDSWWRRYLLLVGSGLVAGLAWRVLAFAVGWSPSTGVQSAVTLLGIAFGAWLVYFGGSDRLRGESTEVSET